MKRKCHLLDLPCFSPNWHAGSLVVLLVGRSLLAAFVSEYDLSTPSPVEKETNFVTPLLVRLLRNSICPLDCQAIDAPATPSIDFSI